MDYKRASGDERATMTITIPADVLRRAAEAIAVGEALRLSVAVDRGREEESPARGVSGELLAVPLARPMPG
jgi:hypothetical protein